jgi:hypothetical protein
VPRRGQSPQLGPAKIARALLSEVAQLKNGRTSGIPAQASPTIRLVVRWSRVRTRTAQLWARLVRGIDDDITPIRLPWNGTPIFFNDTYTFDGTVWTKRTPVTSPSPRAYSTMAYDEARGLVVLFGGLDAKGAVLGDTWTWDGTNWSKRTMKGPPARSGSAMTYDPLRGKTVLFGGQGSRKCPVSRTT